MKKSIQAVQSTGRLQLIVASDKGNKEPFVIDTQWVVAWPGLVALLSWLLVPLLLSAPNFLKEIAGFIDFLVMGIFFIYLFHDVIAKAVLWTAKKNEPIK